MDVLVLRTLNHLSVSLRKIVTSVIAVTLLSVVLTVDHVIGSSGAVTHTLCWECTLRLLIGADAL